MSSWLQLLLFASWIGIGFLIGRRRRRLGTGVLWAVVLGPIGLLVFGYGEWRRQGLRHEAGPKAVSVEDLDLPVQVLIGDQWRDGRLQTWVQDASEWHGWVRYTEDGEARAAWFTSEQLRKENAS